MRHFFKAIVTVLLVIFIAFPNTGLLGSERQELDVLYASGQEIPLATVKKIASEEAARLWGHTTLGVIIPLCDVRGNILAYEMVFALNISTFPEDDAIFSDIRLSKEQLEISGNFSRGKPDSAMEKTIKERWGINSFATIVIGARYDVDIILEYHTGLPPYFTRLEEARAKASKELGVNQPVLRRIYAIGYLDKWFQFEGNQRSVLVNVYSLKTNNPQLINELANRERSDLRQNDASEIRKTWNYFTTPTSTNDKKGISSLTGTTTRSIPGVPFYYWFRGCTPTSTAMIFGYWDAHGFSRLLNSTPNALINELADAMGTDSEGSTIYIANPMAILSIANNSRLYNFSSGWTIPGFYFENGTANSHWGDIQTEINAGRPVIWNVHDYTVPENQPNAGRAVNHSVVAVGYKKVTSSEWYWPFDRWYCYALVHTTWDYQEHYWMVLKRSNITSGFYYDESYDDCIVTVEPGGASITAAPTVNYDFTEYISYYYIPPDQIIDPISAPQMSWPKVLDATRYTIYRRDRTNGMTTSWVQIGTTTSLTFYDNMMPVYSRTYSSMPNGDWVQYTVRALNYDGLASADSNTIYYQIMNVPTYTGNGDPIYTIY